MISRKHFIAEKPERGEDPKRKVALVNTPESPIYALHKNIAFVIEYCHGSADRTSALSNIEMKSRSTSEFWPIDRKNGPSVCQTKLPWRNCIFSVMLTKTGSSRQYVGQMTRTSVETPTMFVKSQSALFCWSLEIDSLVGLKNGFIFQCCRPQVFTLTGHMSPRYPVQMYICLQKIMCLMWQL